jgi:hypothetical protein
MGHAEHGLLRLRVAHDCLMPAPTLPSYTDCSYTVPSGGSFASGLLCKSELRRPLRIACACTRCRARGPRRPVPTIPGSRQCNAAILPGHGRSATRTSEHGSRQVCRRIQGHVICNASGMEDPWPISACWCAAITVLATPYNLSALPRRCARSPAKS